MYYVFLYISDCIRNGCHLRFLGRISPVGPVVSQCLVLPLASSLVVARDYLAHTIIPICVLKAILIIYKAIISYFQHTVLSFGALH